MILRRKRYAYKSCLLQHNFMRINVLLSLWKFKMRGVQLPAFIFLVSAYLIMRPTFTSGSITRMPIGCHHLVSGLSVFTANHAIHGHGSLSCSGLCRHRFPSGWPPMCSNVRPILSCRLLKRCLILATVSVLAYPHLYVYFLFRLIQLRIHTYSITTGVMYAALQIQNSAIIVNASGIIGALATY